MLSAAETITTLVNLDWTNGAYPSASMVRGYNFKVFGVNDLRWANQKKGHSFQVSRERDFSASAKLQRGGNGAAQVRS